MLDIAASWADKAVELEEFEAEAVELGTVVAFRPARWNAAAARMWPFGTLDLAAAWDLCRMLTIVGVGAAEVTGVMSTGIDVNAAARVTVFDRPIA